MVSLLAAVEVASASADASPRSDMSRPAPARSHRAVDARLHAPVSLPESIVQERRKGARVFTSSEKHWLEDCYTRDKFPTREAMCMLAAAMGKGSGKVRTWFNNRRSLDRKLGGDVTRNEGLIRPEVFVHGLHGTAPVHPYPGNVELRQQHHNHPQNSRGPLDVSPSSLSPPSLSPQPQRPNQFLEATAPTPRPTGSRPGLFSMPPTTPPLGTKPEQHSLWPLPPAVSPVTGDRAPVDAVNATLSFGGQAQRQASVPAPVRLTPLRLRNVRLTMGSTDLCGEGQHPRPDVGLEVKFLFGKKRLVYEWYCGSKFADASVTGGPYAKAEMSFASVSEMYVTDVESGSLLRLSLAKDPVLFLQTQESMAKYKSRLQQRQYSRVEQREFPVTVPTKDHCICLRPEDAARVTRIITDSVPELARLLARSATANSPARSSPLPHPRLRLDHDVQQPDRSLDPAIGRNMDSAQKITASNALVTAVSSTANAPIAPSRKQSQQPKSSPGFQNAFPKAGSVPMAVMLGKDRARGLDEELPDGDGHDQNDMPTACERYSTVTEPFSNPSVTPASGTTPVVSRRPALPRADCFGSQQPIVQATTAAAAATNLLATPAHWLSPATPFVSTLRPRADGEGVLWTEGPANISATPLVERLNAVGVVGLATPNDAKVRRELNFNSAFRRGLDAQTPLTSGHKRRAPESWNDENDSSAANRPRTAHVQPFFPMPALPHGVPAPPAPPPLPMSVRLDQASDGRVDEVVGASSVGQKGHADPPASCNVAGSDTANNAADGQIPPAENPNQGRGA